MTPDYPLGLHGPDPAVSIIVPVYNVAGYVGACLDSLRCQTFENFEVIVVDDGSTDGSLVEIWGAIGLDPRFHVITRRNGGLSAARNSGLRLARGAFVGFVDSDDRVAPGYLTGLLTALAETGADWAACGVRFVLEDGRTHDHPAIHGERHPAVSHPGPAEFRFRDWSDVIRHFPSAWNKLYRRDLIAGLEFVEGIYYEDHPFFYACARRTDRLAYVPEPLYWQTQGRDGQITRESSERVFEQFDVLDRIDREMQASDRPGRDRALARIASRLVFERSVAISDPDLLDRFAGTGRRYFEDRGLTYDAGWDKDIGQLWGLRISGDLPLGIILSVDEADERLTRTLASLARCTFRDFEVILVQSDDDEARQDALLDAAEQVERHWVLNRPAETGVAALEEAAEAATSVFLLILEPGDTLPEDPSIPGVLEWMLRSGADMWAPPETPQDRVFPHPIFRRDYLLHGAAAAAPRPVSSDTDAG